eukprot:2863421-Amphidinium_carterae.1
MAVWGVPEPDTYVPWTGGRFFLVERELSSEGLSLEGTESHRARSDIAESEASFNVDLARIGDPGPRQITDFERLEMWFTARLLFINVQETFLPTREAMREPSATPGGLLRDRMFEEFETSDDCSDLYKSQDLFVYNRYNMCNEISTFDVVERAYFRLPIEERDELSEEALTGLPEDQGPWVW